MKFRKFCAAPNSIGNRIDLSYEVYDLEIDDIEKALNDALKVSIRRREDDFEYSIKSDVVYDYKVYKLKPKSRKSSELSLEPWPRIECLEEQDKCSEQRRWIYIYYANNTTIDHLKIVIEDSGFVQESSEKANGFPNARLQPYIVYCYHLIPKGSNPATLPAEYKAATMATANYHSTDTLYSWLPRLYQVMDKDGNLKKFLDVFGEQFDFIRSYIEAFPKLFDHDHCHYQLLPLYAQWIGWDLSYQPNIRLQRNEIRYAIDLYKRIGTIPGCRLMVKRLTGWDCDIKEFYKNVFFSNDNSSRTVDTSNSQLLQYVNEFEDELHYTYDTGRGEDDWYSFNTVGIFVGPNRLEKFSSIMEKKKRLMNNFNIFLPTNIRGLVIIKGLIRKEFFEEHFDLLRRTRDTSIYNEEVG
jgi:phage tail-like protein